MVINNGITITFGTTISNKENTFPISYNNYVVVFCSIQDSGDSYICTISIDWKTNTSFFVTTMLNFNQTIYNVPTFWISIGY